MNALGSTAFRDDLTPWTMTLSAEQVESVEPETAEELRSFARDFAAIRNLLEQSNGGADLDTIRRYTA